MEVHPRSEMKNSLHGKTAIVTGGSRGIGFAIAEALLKQGVAVAICGRNREHVVSAVQMLSPSGQIVGMATDVANPEEVARFFRFCDDSLGELDILVNNAGIGIFRPVSDLSVEDWKQTLDTNLSGAFYCCREAISRMRHRDEGAIVNMSSLAGRNPFAGGAAYNASKFGLNGFSEAMMLDHRYDHIRVMYIMPGSVDTNFSSRTERASWKIAPEDVADMVLAVLQMPARTTVSRVEIRPSLPPR